MFVQRGRRSADPWGLLLPCQAAAGKRYRRSFLRPRDLEPNATGPTDGASRWPVPAAIDGTAIEVDRMVTPSAWLAGVAARSPGAVQGLVLPRPHGPEV
jgi:hypothetical protein